MEVDADCELSAAGKASFLELVRKSNQACQSGDFDTAVSLYGEAIALDPCNHILFSNRSAALVKLGQFARALQDASRAVELNAKWPKVNLTFNPFYLFYRHLKSKRTSRLFLFFFFLFYELLCFPNAQSFSLSLSLHYYEIYQKEKTREE